MARKKTARKTTKKASPGAERKVQVVKRKQFRSLAESKGGKGQRSKFRPILERLAAGLDEDEVLKIPLVEGQDSKKARLALSTAIRTMGPPPPKGKRWVVCRGVDAEGTVTHIGVGIGPATKFQARKGK